MTAKQIVRFLGNADSTAIEFRQFNLAPKDKYPTFTICFTGFDLYWSQVKPIFRAFGLHPTKFGEMLKGDDVFSYEYNYNSMLYDKISVNFNDYKSLDVERYSLKISKMLTGLEFVTQPENTSILYGSGELGKRVYKIPLDKSHNTSDTICFTRTSEEQIGTLRTYDWLAFSKSVFGNKRFILQIFVHYPQQLMRSFHKPVFRSIISETTDFGTKLLKITIGKVTILRKRPSANVPCDEKLVDDDAKFQEEFIKHINCTPPYWSGRSGNNFPQRKCQSKYELQIADILIQQYRAILKNYVAPCNQMEIFTRYDREEELNDGDDPRVMFLYEDSAYEEIQNTKSFDLESFVSGVGGFIGIFLGYSILQIPELLVLLTTFMRNLGQDNEKGKINRT